MRSRRALSLVAAAGATLQLAACNGGSVFDPDTDRQLRDDPSLSALVKSTTNGPAAINQWKWRFGDGGTSTLKDPEHTYTQVGTYTVTLVVTDSLGYSDGEVKTDIVVVREAADVDEAVSAAALCRPDVVLLDWDLSRPSSSRNGDLTVSSLRAASPGSFVIALSGLPEASREALAAGVDAFVSKGDPPEELLAAVEGCGRKLGNRIWPYPG